MHRPRTSQMSLVGVAVAAVLGTLAVPAGAEDNSGNGPVVDLPIDCGADHRDWFDLQPDVDFPVPPPGEAEPALEAIGCPPGEPTYGPGPFNPPDSASRAPHGVRESTSPPEAAPMLAVALADKHLTARRGRNVRIVYELTRASRVSVELRHGPRTVLRTRRRGTSGYNRLVIRPRRTGRFAIVVRARSADGQRATDTGRITVRGAE